MTFRRAILLGVVLVLPWSATAWAQPADQPGANTGGLLGALEEDHRLLWQQAEQKFLDLEGHARRAVLDKKFEDAQKLALEAQYVIDRNKQFARTTEQYEAWREKARGLKSFVDDERIDYDEYVARQKRVELANAERERIERMDRARTDKIALLKNQAEELRKERKYDEAIQILKNVLALDPTDSHAAWMKTTLEDFAASNNAREISTVKGNELRDVMIENDESSIPWHKDILYPKNWREISAIRTAASDQGEDERTLEVRRQLNKTVPDVSFDGITFEEVITYIADLTNLNIVANWPALEAVAIERDIEVNLELKEVSAEKLLKQVLEQVGAGETELAYDIDDGVITISTREDLARRTLLKVYNVEDLLVNVPDFIGQQISLQNIGQQSGQGGLGGGQGGGQGNLFEGGGAGGQQNNQQDDQVTIDVLITLIQSVIDPESWRVNGGNIGSVRPLRNQLIVTQTSTAHAQLRDLLKQLREAHAIQIAVEARFITVTRNYLEQIGVDLDIVLNNGNAGFDRAGFQQSPLRDPATGSLVLVPREFSRLGLTPLAPGGLGFSPTTQAFPQPFGQPGLIPAPGSIAPHSSRFTPVPIQNNTLDLAAPIATNIPGSLGGAETLPALSLFGSFLDNIQVDFLLQATQVEARQSDLDAPRLVLFNGQRALFSAFIEQDYVASLTPVLGDNVGLFQPNILTALTGRQLDVDATVSADRRYVTMTIRTFTQVSGDPVPFQFTGGSLTGGAGFVQLIRRTTNSVQTTVSVPDGGTLLIGGLKQAGERERDAGVPVLSRIPVLKRAFSNTSLVKDDRVLLILVKPKIIIQDEAEEEAFPTLTRSS